MADIELLLEAERRGLLPPDKQAYIDEARVRGLLPPKEGATQRTLKDKIGQDVISGVNEGKNIENQYNQGQISLPSAVGQYVGNVGGKIGRQVTGDVLTAGYEALPAPVRQGISSIGKGIQAAGSYLPGMETYNRGVTDLIQGGNQLAETSPLFRSAANVTGLAMNLGVPEQIISPIRAGVNALSDAELKMPQFGKSQYMPVTGANIKNPVVEPEVIKGIAKDLYRGSEQYGGVANSKFNADAADTVLSHKISDPYAGPRADLVNNDLSSIAETFKKEPFSIENYSTLDSRLNTSAFEHLENGSATLQSTVYTDLKNSLREKVLNPKPEYFDDPSAFEAARQASKVMRQYFIAKDLSDLAEKALSKDVPSKSLSTLAANLKFNGKKTLGMSDEELALIDKAATRGSAVEVLRLMASKLNTVAAYAAISAVPTGAVSAEAGLASAATAGATYVAGRLANKLATHLQSGPIREFQRNIGRTVSKEAEIGQKALMEKPTLNTIIKGKK